MNDLNRKTASDLIDKTIIDAMKNYYGPPSD